LVWLDDFRRNIVLRSLFGQFEDDDDFPVDSVVPLPESVGYQPLAFLVQSLDESGQFDVVGQLNVVFAPEVAIPQISLWGMIELFAEEDDSTGTKFGKLNRGQNQAPAKVEDWEDGSRVILVCWNPTPTVDVATVSG